MRRRCGQVWCGELRKRLLANIYGGKTSRRATFDLRPMVFILPRRHRKQDDNYGLVSPSCTTPITHIYFYFLPRVPSEVFPFPDTVEDCLKPQTRLVVNSSTKAFRSIQTRTCIPHSPLVSSNLFYTVLLLITQKQARTAFSLNSCGIDETYPRDPWTRLLVLYIVHVVYTTL